MKNILVILSFVLFNLGALAQDFNDAVVYIQGNKEVPIYVKMEGQMMPRYGKDYTLLYNLASGPLHLEIQFQQNQYPSQKFVLNIQPSSQRSLVLTKVAENKFALYDLNYEFYLPADNKLEDDIQAQNTVAVDNKAIEPLTKKSKETEIVANKKEKKEKIKGKKEDDLPPFLANAGIEKGKADKKENKLKTKKAKEQKKAEEETVAKNTEKVSKPKKEEGAKKEIKESSKTDNRFLDFEMNKDSGSNVEKESKEKCKEAASNEQFNSFAQLISSAKDEEERLLYLKKYSGMYCFSTDQVRVVAMNFDSQSSRYEVVKVLKKKTIDVENYKDLEVLFNTNYLKKKFINEIANIK
ncbi:MAG TPA: DUF4476 domain-containing protein [Edaphocola sp.]|nr:DUF4476 domain-containing protein [Edaphocola sp.]